MWIHPHTIQSIHMPVHTDHSLMCMTVYIQFSCSCTRLGYPIKVLTYSFYYTATDDNMKACTYTQSVHGMLPIAL